MSYAGDAGCGLGGLIIQKNSKILQLLAVTTNHSFLSQEFGITFGTSGCSASGLVMNEKKMAVVYDQAGKMLFTETELTENMYNKMALKYIKENYDAKYKIAYMRKVDTYDKKTTFIAMLKKGKELLEVEFDKKGNFIRDTDKTPATVSKKPAKKKKEEKEEEDEDEDVDKPQPEKSKSSKSKKKAKEDEEEEEE